MVRPLKVNRRNRIVSFRLTESEFLQLSHQAAAANLRANALARELVLSKALRLVIKTHARHDPALVKQLYHISHNLNQITKAVHLGRISSQIEQLCQSIENIMDEAMGEDNEY